MQSGPINLFRVGIDNVGHVSEPITLRQIDSRGFMSPRGGTPVARENERTASDITIASGARVALDFNVYSMRDSENSSVTLMLAIPYPTAASGMYGAYDLTLTFRTTPYGVGLGYMEISAKCDHSFCLGVHIEDRGRNASGVLTGGVIRLPVNCLTNAYGYPR
ncbi:hypothetical protein CEQ31_026240 [Serratia odorifera]|nr:hypothetical protein CEQ31_026240 [Serratia odorifera]